MEKESKKTIVFYEKWYNAIKKAPEDIQPKLLKAVMDYAFDGTIPTDREVSIAFAFIQEQLDEDQQKYSIKCERNRKNAKNRCTKTNQTEQSLDLVGNSNCNSNGNCNGNCDINSDDKKNPSNEGKEVAASAAALQKKKEDFLQSLEVFIPKYGEEMITDFFSYWTETNKSKTKMRFELEKTWEIGRRLGTWARKDNNFNQYAASRTNNSAGQTAEERMAGYARVMQRILDGGQQAEGYADEISF